MGFAPPPRGGFAFIAAPERQSARDNYRTNLEEGDIYAEWPFIWSQAGLLYARWLFRKRTSQNAGRANFLEIRFGEVRILGILGSSRRKVVINTAFEGCAALLRGVWCNRCVGK